MSGETLQIYFLGTAGTLPTPIRNQPCLLVRHGSDMLLFDCGEGAQQQMMRARCGFTLTAIFVTHWHADHFLGIFGLVQTLSFNGRTDPLTIYGPEGVHDFVATLKRVGRRFVMFPIEASELTDRSEVRFEGYSVRSFSVRHRIPALGYILEEDSRPGRFDKEAALRLGVRSGPLFGRLQRGETVRVGSGERVHEIRPDMVMGERRPGRKIVYTGDTLPIHTKIRDIASDADLLIHDATFDETEDEKAKEFQHSTALQAGEAATALKSRSLALVHISSRYTNPDNHLREAKKRFAGPLFLPDDLEMHEIAFRNDL